MAYVRASKRVQLLRACIRGVLDLLLARRAERVAVMQIGAHLAWMNYNDPFGSVVRHTLNRRNATAFLAVVVEPQPHVFQRLRQSSKQFAASGVVRFENVAVCASGAASVDFFLVDPSVDMVSGRDNRTGIRALLQGRHQRLHHGAWQGKRQAGYDQINSRPTAFFHIRIQIRSTALNDFKPVPIR